MDTHQVVILKTTGGENECSTEREYDQDFKRNAVLLTAEPGKTVADVAKNLGVNKDLLYRWRREYHNGREALTARQRQIRELEKRLREAEVLPVKFLYLAY